MTKDEKLAMAVALLNEADGLIQEALGATEQCYQLHTIITDTADEVEELVNA